MRGREGSHTKRHYSEILNHRFPPNKATNFSVSHYLCVTVRSWSFYVISLLIGYHAPQH